MYYLKFMCTKQNLINKILSKHIMGSYYGPAKALGERQGTTCHIVMINLHQYIQSKKSDGTKAWSDMEKSKGVMENLDTFWKGYTIAFFLTETESIPAPVMARYELASATWYHILSVVRMRVFRREEESRE